MVITALGQKEPGSTSGEAGGGRGAAHREMVLIEVSRASQKL